MLGCGVAAKVEPAARRASTTAPVQVPGLPQPPPAQPAGACGAPAVAGRDAEAAVERSDEEPAEQREAQRAATPDAPAPDSDSDAWEDVEREGEGGGGLSGSPGGEAAAGGSGGGGDGGALTISFSHEEMEQQQAQQQKAKRRAFTKADRERARTLHRVHMLCLLARGLLYDEAAGSPLLQVGGWVRAGWGLSGVCAAAWSRGAATAAKAGRPFQA